MPPEQDEKTEPATPKRREDSREKGQVAKSREVTSVAVMFAGVLYFVFFSQKMGGELARLGRFFFQGAAGGPMGAEGLFTVLMDGLLGIGAVVMPLLVLVVIFSIVSHVLQFGVLFAPQALIPKFGKLNPLEGAKRLLGKQGWMDLFKSLAKVALVTYVAYLTLAQAWTELPRLSQMSPEEIIGTFARVAIELGLRSTVVLLLIAGVDYAFQKYQYERNLMMTKDEVKQEFKRREGDPLVKSRVRQVQREMSRKRMMSAVPEADVVITNPTHYAVAVLYDRGNMEAPSVVAKGKGYIALRIREIAEENDVPVVENKSLAQTLFRTVPVGQLIPGDLYKAVAEVLAYVYRLKKKAA